MSTRSARATAVRRLRLPRKTKTTNRSSARCAWKNSSAKRRRERREEEGGTRTVCVRWTTVLTPSFSLLLFIPFCALLFLWSLQDLTDLSFHPCKCGYQICLWCYHQMIEADQAGDAKCPACRAPFTERSKDASTPIVAPTEILAQAAAYAMVAQNQAKMVIKKKNSNAYKERQTVAAPGPNTKDLSNQLVMIEGAGLTPLSEVRVVQRNLAYVVGLSSACGREDLLRKREWFGGFGKAIKVAVAKSFGVGGTSSTTATFAAYTV